MFFFLSFSSFVAIAVGWLAGWLAGTFGGCLKRFGQITEPPAVSTGIIRGGGAYIIAS